MAAIFEYKMAAIFGSYSEFLAAPPDVITRMWLVFQVEIAAENEQAQRFSADAHSTTSRS